MDFRSRFSEMLALALVVVAVSFLLSSCAAAYYGLSNTRTQEPSVSQTTADTKANAPDSPENPEKLLVNRAYEVLELIKNEDYASLAAVIHTEKGLTFTPYSTVDPMADVCFTPDQVMNIASNNTEYIWGISAGEGAPISMKVADYIDRFVYNRDFASAGVIGVNSVIKQGNALENVSEVFTDASFVEFHIPGADASYQGLDWYSLKLVFESSDGELKLIALIHSEWTI